MSKKSADGSGSGRKRSGRGRQKDAVPPHPEDSADVLDTAPDDSAPDGSAPDGNAPDGTLESGAEPPEDNGSDDAESADGDASKTSRPVLPAFGFADEVLAQRRQKAPSSAAGESTPDRVPTDSSSSGSAAAPSASASSANAPSSEVPSSEVPSADRIYDFADSLAKRSFEDDQAAPRRITTWVTFDLAEEIFAIPVDDVREVLRVATVTRVPHAPHPIRGVTNLRGKVIPVIDLRRRIELAPVEIGRSSRILVVNPRGRVIGLLVDAVRQVVHLDLDQVQAPPEDVMTVQSDYLTGVYQQGDDLLLLLDVERTLVIKESGAA